MSCGHSPPSVIRLRWLRLILATHFSFVMVATEYIRRLPENSCLRGPALEPTESNIKFLYSFIKLLLTNGGAELEPEDDDVIHKAVQDMYLLDPENRRLSNLFLPKKLDNVEDSLSLSRL